MQNKNFTLDGSGKATIVAPCSCDEIEIYCSAHTFTFQYAVRGDEAPAMVDGPQKPTKGDALGDASSAEAYATTLFKFVADSPRGAPWKAGDIIGYVVGTAADVVVVRPRKAAGS